MSGTWTPGPWRTTGPDNPQRGGILDADGLPLATVYWRDGGGEAELEANASLIATAPTLVELLTEVVGVLERSFAGTLREGAQRTPQEWLAAARAALAKARGEQ